MLKPPIWKHFAAFVYDIFPILGILILTSGTILVFRSGNDVQPYTWWFILITYLEVALYYIYSWKIGGQTIGMKAWKIKLKSLNEQEQITWAQSTFRFIAGVVSTLLLGAGIFWKLFSNEQKSWMDLISSSLTVSEDH